MWFKLFTGILASAMLSGCQSGFSQYYEDYSVPLSARLSPPTSDPRVVAGVGNAEQVISSMFVDGYVLIGKSLFNGPIEGRVAAIKKAREVGAEIIVLDVRYTNTNQGAVPITTQQAMTSTTRGNVSAYGGGRSVVGTYSGTTTTVAPQTSYIPYSVNIYDQQALFFARQGIPCVGVLLGELSDEDRRSIGSNKAVRILAVRRNSPAYDSDIIAGDLILSIDGQSNSPDFRLRRGVSSSMAVKRGARDMIISVTGGDGCPN
jgi:hypothetical protein